MTEWLSVHTQGKGWAVPAAGGGGWSGQGAAAAASDGPDTAGWAKMAGVRGGSPALERTHGKPMRIWNLILALLSPVILDKWTSEPACWFIKQGSEYFTLSGSLKIQFSSVTQSYPILRDPMDCSTLGFPIHHHLLELTQTHVYWIGDAIQPSHPVALPSPPVFNLSQHSFQWVGSSHQVAKDWNFSFNISPSNEYSGLISFRVDKLELLAIQGTFKSLSSTTIWRRQFFGTQTSLWSNSHIHTWLLEKL